MSQQSLLLNADLWESDPDEAFHSWLVSGKGAAKPIDLKPSSIKVYRSIWRAFCGEMAARGVAHPLRCDAERMAAYFERLSGRARQEHARKSRMLISQLWDWLHARGIVGSNPCAEARPPRAWADGPMEFLDDEAVGLLFAELAAPPDAGSRAGRTRMRARALVALMLGAGTKPGHALVISVNCARGCSEGTLRLEAHDEFLSREVRFEPRARPALEAWIELRESQGPGKLLFPAAVHGPERVADYASAFRSVKELLRELGLAKAPPADASEPATAGKKPAARRADLGAGPQTLRNTYGAMLIDAGADIPAVKAALGYHRAEFAERFVANHARWRRQTNLDRSENIADRP